MRRTKIVATIGPASDQPEALAALLDAGVDVVRVNLAHGEVKEHVARIDLVARSSNRRGKKVAVLVDLPGPKVRSATFPEGGSVLHTGDEVELVSGQTPSDEERIIVDESHLTDCVTRATRSSSATARCR